MTAMFAGICSDPPPRSLGASMLGDGSVGAAVANSIPLPDYLHDAVRSMDGVQYAVPSTRRRPGEAPTATTSRSTIIGLDDTSLYGRPALAQGKIEDIYGENGFIVVHDAEFRKLNSPAIGAEFEINDHRAVIVGIAKVRANGLFGVPTLYTTFNRAGNTCRRRALRCPMCWSNPRPRHDIPRIEAAVAKLGYLALTRTFDKRIANFYTFQTGIGINIMLMSVISFVVGLSISGQTFYTFVLENIDKFGALKAIGAQGRGAGLHDPVPGALHRSDRLWPGRRPVRPGDRVARHAEFQLCRGRHLRETFSSPSP